MKKRMLILLIVAALLVGCCSVSPWGDEGRVMPAAQRWQVSDLPWQFASVDSENQDAAYSLRFFH